MSEARIHKKKNVTFSEILKKFEDRTDNEVGAIGSFIGMVRETGAKGGMVEELNFECAETADQELRTIEEEVEEKNEGISEVEIHHFIDDLEPGEEIIYVLVGGKHREEVFQNLPVIMDRVKSEARIWKKEITENESYWIHEVQEKG